MRDILPEAIQQRIAEGERETAEGEKLELAHLRNIHPRWAYWLAQVGIRTRADLEAAGPVEAWIRLREKQGRWTYIILDCLIGALLDVPKEEVPREERRRARHEIIRRLGHFP